MMQTPKERLSRTSMSLAVMSVFTIFVFPVILPYVFGSVALVMAILSKGGSERFPRRSRTAAIISGIAIAVNTALLVMSVLFFIQVLHDPQLQKQFGETLYKTYGITFEELMNQLGIPYTPAM